MKNNYKELSFTNDFMFCRILENNPELCKEIAETILDVKIKEIIKVDKQHYVKSTPDSHGVRFDVYFEDDENTVYDIEMQTASNINIRKRSRYYQSMIDRRNLDKGVPYAKLKKSYIIFICTFDLFGKGLCKYTFQNFCEEDKSLALEDDAIRVFVNAMSKSENLSPGMADFIQYIASGNAEGSLSKKIENDLERARRNTEWEDAYMTLEDKMQEKYEEGIEVGKVEGKAEAISAIETAGVVSEEQIKKIKELLRQ